MPSWTSGVRRHVLPNGITLLIQQDDSAPVVAVVTHVKAGYFDEPDEWVGIAHVLEHMFFKGTRRRGPGDLARETQHLGGYLNASTIYDKTVYYTVLPSGEGALERAVDIQGDALMNAALDQAELSRELEVVIQEAKRKLDNPPAVATETLYQLLFQKHRMRRWRIGTEEGLRRLDSAALRRYYATRYAPARTIVGLVGKLDADQALEHARRVYGDWRVDHSPIDESPLEPSDGRQPAIKILNGDIERPLAVIGWRTTSELHPHTPALDVAAVVLGSGRGSWLSRFVRTPGLAGTVSASHYTPTEVGVFDLTLEGDEARLEAAVVRTLELAARLAEEGPDPGELARVRSLITTRWSRAFETVDGRAASLCEFEALGDFALADQLFQATSSVQAEDVRQVAATYLKPESASAVFYLPRTARIRFGLEGVRWPPAPGRSDFSVQSPDISEPAQPPGPKGKRRRQTGVLHVPLRGVDLLVQSKRGSGLASIGLYVPGMRDEEDEASAGTSWLLARSGLRGAAGRTAEELALAAESMGGAIIASAGVQALGWSITVPVVHLGKAARLLRSVALEPTLDPEQIRIERELQAADAARARDDMYRYPLQRVLGLAFPRDPYGLPPLGTPEGVRQIDEKHLRNWSDAVARRRAIAIAVGDLESGRLVDALSLLEDWPGTDVARRVEVPRFRAGTELEAREKAQSAIAMAFSSSAANTPRRFSIEVLSDFLSGLAGRLFQVLREERGLAYTVVAAPWAQRRAGVLLTYIATSPDRETEAREAMLETLEQVARGKVSEPEVERARNYSAGLVQIGRQTSAAILGEILGAWVNDLMDDLPDLPRELRAVTIDDVVREASEIFDRENRTEFVIRGTAR